MEERVTNLPLGDRPVDVDYDTEFASKAIQLSRDAFTTALHSYRDEMQSKAEDVLERRLRRLTRVHASQIERIQVRIDEETNFIQTAEADPTPQKTKILPARKGRLNKALERKDQLNASFEQESEELRAKRPDIRGEIFSVSVLVGA